MGQRKKENTSSQISLSSKKASKTQTKAFFSFKVKAKKFKLKRNKISFKSVSGLQHCEVENTYNDKNVRESIKTLEKQEKVCYSAYFVKVGKNETDEIVSYKLEVELSVIWKK